MRSVVPFFAPIPFVGSTNVRAAVEYRSLTLDWAAPAERVRVIALATAAGRQTMNLRTMPGAVLVVLRRDDGGFAGWAGMDVESDPEHPEVFSQFVYPEFRGAGLGRLLEHVWWTYLDAYGCTTGFMRMEFDSNRKLFESRLASGYCRQVTAQTLAPQFVRACRKCELFGEACRRQVYLAVDVRRALAACVASRGPLDLDAFPLILPMRSGAKRAPAAPMRVTG